MRHISKITAGAFGLSTISTITQSALGRPLDRFGLLDMAMPSLTATLALSTKPGRTRDAATMALLAATAGDMSATWTFKIGWFGASHLAWITALHKGHCKRWWPLGAAIIGAGLWATARAGNLRPACAAYACLVAAMAITASGYSRLAGASAVAFALSDFLIGVGVWRAQLRPAWGEAVILALYLAAQAGLTAAVIKEEGRGDE